MQWSITTSEDRAVPTLGVALVTPTAAADAIGKSLRELFSWVEPCMVSSTLSFPSNIGHA